MRCSILGSGWREATGGRPSDGLGDPTGSGRTHVPRLSGPARPGRSAPAAGSLPPIRPARAGERAAERRPPVRDRSAQPRRAVPRGERRARFPGGGGAGGRVVPDPRRGSRLGGGILGRRGGRRSHATGGRRPGGAAALSPVDRARGARAGAARRSHPAHRNDRLVHDQPTGARGDAAPSRGELRPRRRGARRLPAPDYLPAPAGECRRTAPGRGHARRRRRDPARGRALVPRARRAAADAVMGRHDLGCAARSWKQPPGSVSSPESPSPSPSWPPTSSATPCATLSIPEAHDPSARRARPAGLVPDVRRPPVPSGGRRELHARPRRDARAGGRIGMREEPH